MKKLLSVAFMAILALTFMSCKKNYTCTCTYVDGTGATQTNLGTIKGTKSQAQSACNSNADDLQSIGTSVSCHL